MVIITSSNLSSSFGTFGSSFGIQKFDLDFGIQEFFWNHPSCWKDVFKFASSWMIWCWWWHEHQQSVSLSAVLILPFLICNKEAKWLIQGDGKVLHWTYLEIKHCITEFWSRFKICISWEADIYFSSSSSMLYRWRLQKFYKVHDLQLCFLKGNTKMPEVVLIFQRQAHLYFQLLFVSMIICSYLTWDTNEWLAILRTNYYSKWCGLYDKWSTVYRYFM